MGKKTTLWATSVFAVILFAASLMRDTAAVERYPRDLRNRIVGARLQADGQSPYFYKWKPQDGIRYYDPTNFDQWKASAITSSPFLHHLLLPISNWPQHAIARFWMYLQYGMWTIMVLIFVWRANNWEQRLAIMEVAALFLFSAYWQNNVLHGQTYLLIPFLVTLFWVFLQQPEKWYWALAAGMAAALLLGIRPTAFLILLPLLLVLKSHSRGYWMTMSIPVLLLFGLSISLPKERELWVEYQRNIAEQVKIHQDLQPQLQTNAPDPEFPAWEGWNRATVQSLNQRYPWDEHAEFSNVYLFYRNLFKQPLPVKAMSFLSVLLLVAVSTVFLIRRRKSKLPVNPASCLLLGYLLYMITDFCSPIARGQYYGVQWLFPLLLMASEWKRKKVWVAVLLLAALLLSTLNLSWLPMEHTMGELLLLLSTLLVGMKIDVAKAGDELNPQ